MHKSGYPICVCTDCNVLLATMSVLRPLFNNAASADTQVCWRTFDPAPRGVKRERRFSFSSDDESSSPAAPQSRSRSGSPSNGNRNRRAGAGPLTLRDRRRLAQLIRVVGLTYASDGTLQRDQCAEQRLHVLLTATFDSRSDALMRLAAMSTQLPDG